MEGRRPITRGRAWPAIALAALAAMAPAACSTFSGKGTTALSFMKQVRENSDPNARYKAYIKLASPGAYDNDAQKADAVRVMAEALGPNASRSPRVPSSAGPSAPSAGPRPATPSSRRSTTPSR